jgi:hypothetical protein
MKYQLSNKEREYLGLDPIQSNWDLVEFRGDQYRPESILAFDGDIVKRQIISTEDSYKEYQYDDLIRNREFISPKTKRGKEKKLSPSTFEIINPTGVYFNYGAERVTIASITTQTTFYSTKMESIKIPKIEDFKFWLETYITETSEINKTELRDFKNSKRKNIKTKKGDVFAFKIDRNNYGYGQVVENIDKLRKTLHGNHGLSYLMGKPILVRLFHHNTIGIQNNVESIIQKKATPSQYIFDNHLFYGEYKVIGNADIPEREIDFPISYGRVLYASPEIYLQWGIIHKQKSRDLYNKYLTGINELISADSPSYNVTNPFSKNSIGYHLDIDKKTILECINRDSNKPYWNQNIYKMKRDLRNPINKKIREELFKEFQITGDEYFIQNDE